MHEGEYVVPRSGQLVVKEDGKSVERMDKMIALLEVISRAVADDRIVIVSTNDPQRAKQHTLDLADQAFALWPS